MTITPLPPLPTTVAAARYTADQMQAYATQARADLEAENQRLREALETIYEAVGVYTLADASDCAAAALKDTK